jgi:dihydroneopterin aldolase
MRTDKLEDAVCYSRIVKAITSFCQTRSFNLLEHLAASIHKVVDSSIISHRNLVASIYIRACKVSPPNKDIYGGAAFTYRAALSDGGG